MIRIVTVEMNHVNSADGYQLAKDAAAAAADAAVDVCNGSSLSIAPTWGLQDQRFRVAVAAKTDQQQSRVVNERYAHKDSSDNRNAGELLRSFANCQH